MHQQFDHAVLNLRSTAIDRNDRIGDDYLCRGGHAGRSERHPVFHDLDRDPQWPPGLLPNVRGAAQRSIGTSSDLICRFTPGWRRSELWCTFARLGVGQFTGHPGFVRADR